MKVILYMAMSLNGIIAKKDDDTSWISKEEWNSYSAAVRKAKCLIVGRRTYDILTKQPEFSEFEKVKVVVVSEKSKPKLVDKNHIISKSPEEAIDLLKNYSEVIVAGGGILNNSFLEKRLINEIFVDIEPIIISQGIHIFNGKSIENNLKLIGQKMISDNEIQLHYKVT